MQKFITNVNDLTSDDIESLVELMKTLSEGKFNENKDKFKNINYWKRIMKLNHIITVRNINNKLVGIGMIVEHVQGFGYFSVEDVVRHPEYKRFGLGEIIMQKIHKTAKSLNIKELNLTSNPERKNAHKLYEKLGYKKIGNTCKFQIKL